MVEYPLTTAIDPRPPFFQRPGWASAAVRLVLYLVLEAGITFALQVVGFPMVRGRRSPYNPNWLFMEEAVAIGGVFAAAWVMSRLELRSFGQYGLALTKGWGQRMAAGAVFGLAEISAVLGALGVLGYYHFGTLAIHGTEILRWALLWAVFFLMVGLFEEFGFRGYLQFTLTQAVGFWPAAICLSLLFGAVHWSNPGESLAGVAGVVLTGLFWCFTLRRTGTLWFAVGMHAAFDFGETFLYSVPDSGYLFPGHLSNATLAGPAWLCGGAAGPEASIFDFVMLVAFFFLFDRSFPAARPSETPLAAIPNAEVTTNETSGGEMRLQ
jgi:membrane protease YdiL (CAAX protease family)